jgi:peptidoglycan/xylan/chitin deacetylase (PgdA/CDA1 family)
VFLTAGLINDHREFWWDELERVLLEPGRLPSRLSFTLDGRCFEWDLEALEADLVLPLGVRRTHDTAQGGLSLRHLLYREIHQLLMALTNSRAADVTSQLLTWAGIDHQARATHRLLSWDEVVVLDASELIEIGAHSMTHANLARLSPPEQRSEIQQSRTRLQEILGHCVSSFAYPYGLYTPVTPLLLEEAGFECACSTGDKVVHAGASVFELPRMMVEDCDGDEFARLLATWFEKECINSAV